MPPFGYQPLKEYFFYTKEELYKSMLALGSKREVQNYVGGNYINKILQSVIGFTVFLLDTNLTGIDDYVAYLLIADVFVRRSKRPKAAGSFEEFINLVKPGLIGLLREYLNNKVLTKFK